MATINTQPQNAVSAYEPAKYVVTSINTASLVEKMVVTVRRTVGSTVVAVLYRDWTRRSGSGPAYTYQFEVDVAGILQSALRPISSARTQQFVLAGTLITDCSNSYLQYNVRFDFLFRSPSTNLLADLGDTATSNNVVAFNVIRPTGRIIEAFRSSRYRNGSTTVFQYFLNYYTTLPIPIALNEFYPLCFITSGQTQYLRIVETRANGTTRTTHLSLGILAGLTDRLGAVNVGPSLLLVIGAGNWEPFGQFPEFLTTVSYKVALTNGFLQQVGFEFSFEIVTRCAGGLRLAWLNQLGGVDIYTFDARVVEGVEGSSEIGIRPNIWTSADEISLPDAKGAFKPNTTRNEFYEVETRVLRPELAKFVSQILTSAEVYIVDSSLGLNPYRSVIIADGQIIESDTDEIGMILKFKVYPANQTPTHVQ